MMEMTKGKKYISLERDSVVQSKSFPLHTPIVKDTSLNVISRFWMKRRDKRLENGMMRVERKGGEKRQWQSLQWNGIAMKLKIETFKYSTRKGYSPDSFFWIRQISRFLLHVHNPGWIHGKQSRSSDKPLFFSKPNLGSSKKVAKAP